MSSPLENAKNKFKKYVRCYMGLEQHNYNENSIRNTLLKIAYNFRANYSEFCKIIIEYLEKEEPQYKIRLFDLIDIFFKNNVGDYVEQLKNYLPSNFYECFMMSDLQDRFLLFRIFYTWKYIVPKNIFEKIKEDSKLGDFMENCRKNLPNFATDMKSCEEFNENFKKEKLKKNANLNNLNIKKEFKEDIIPNNTNDNDKDNKQKKTIKNTKHNLEENSINSNDKIMGKKRKSSQDKSSEGNSKPKKKVKIENKLNNTDNQKNINSATQNNLAPIMNNNPNINNLIPMLPIKQNNTSNMQFMNNTNPNIFKNVLNPAIMSFLQNNPHIFNPLLSNIQSSNVSTQEFIIFKFLIDSKVKLNTDLRFFSSLAKFFNESIKSKDIIDVKCEYEDIYKNPEYQQIRQNVNNSLFSNIKKNICTICGFRTLYYNKLTEHLDIHFNINFLKKEGKNLFRKKGNNRNNWIKGDNALNKNIKSNNANEIGYTLNNLLYYKNMINNNIKKLDNLQQEEDNEELMYPIDENNIKCCEFCGDPFKKVFSNKYHYWFYTEIIKVKDEKTKLFVHKACYDEMTKKI